MPGASSGTSFQIVSGPTVGTSASSELIHAVAVARTQGWWLRACAASTASHVSDDQVEAWRLTGSLARCRT